MRAFAVQKLGDAPAIHELPLPAADDTILIRVKCAGINPVDFKLVDQLSANSTFPFVIGLDFAGVVESVPAGEHGFRAGDRIFGIARSHGSYADYTAVAPGMKTEPLAHIPDGVTDEQAAALPIAGVTALRSLELLGITAEQRLVIMGATGGVGRYAVQMAALRGAHVIATVRANVEAARALGASDVYDAGAVDVIDALHASYPEGVDAVLDLVSNKDAIHRDAEILKAGGHLVSTLYAADETWFAQRQITAYNIASNKNPVSSPDGLRELAHMLADGTISAGIGSTFALDDAGQMFEKLRRGGLRGKTVIRI